MSTDRKMRRCGRISVRMAVAVILGISAASMSSAWGQHGQATGEEVEREGETQPGDSGGGIEVFGEKAGATGEGGAGAAAEPVVEGVSRDPSTVEMKATELGVRMTPQIVEAISRSMTRRMKSDLDLNDEQVASIEKVFSRRLMGFAQDNSEVARDMIETMMAEMIENEGQFDRDAAVDFAKLSGKIMPNLRKFMTESAADIGKELSVTQRLKFTGDMAKAAAGLTLFESAMKKWESGKIPEKVGFGDWDNDGEKEEEAEANANPDEHPDHRRARREVEQWVMRRIEVDKDWERYVERAIKYYGFDEKQSIAANAILKDCTERAEQVKTAKWKAELKEILVARQMSRHVFGDWSYEDPWTYQLDRKQEKLAKPLVDLGHELRRRIEEIPTSAQRASAREALNKKLTKHGLKRTIF